ncbi:MAG: cellulase family glycosylhydrolase [Prolixibacteraceae bacterium]
MIIPIHSLHRRTCLPFLLFFVVMFSGLVPMAQTPFKRGVNLTGWFQTTSTKQIQFTKYTKKDLENIKSLGCDVIRLPINLFYMTAGKPDYKIDPLFYDFLDQVVNWAEELNIYLMLDNHTSDDLASKNPDLENVLVKVWTQMAGHYKSRSNYLLFEIMNEPNGITTAIWGKIQQSAIDAIRSSDTKHTIVVGPSSFNTYNELSLLPVYTDANLIYTFHFYDPFLFTHQGATWVTPSMASLANVPFPYGAAPMPPLPPELLGSWVNSSYNNFQNDGTIAKVKQLIDIAVTFKNNRKVSVFCGEFGVYMKNSNDAFRVSWYNEVRKYLEEKAIPWTIWDYQGGFGLFQNGSDALFDYNLNIPMVNALGLKAPVQKIYSLKPDSVGFPVYREYIGEKIFESSNVGGGTIDYYSTTSPNNGKYCIYWTGTAQYGYIGFNFVPNKDLSRLVANNYAVSFLVRGNTPGTKFDIRFVDTKTTDPLDHPWRMEYTIDETLVPWDGKWHKIYVPLKNFKEMGSYDNVWYSPIGSYDWKATDNFLIVSEQGDLKGKSLWFENIYLTNKDTLQISNSTITGIFVTPQIDKSVSMNVYPNPFKNYVTIDYEINNSEYVIIDIFNMNGQKIKTLLNSRQLPGKYSMTWDPRDLSGTFKSRGIFLCRISLSGKIFTRKISFN